MRMCIFSSLWSADETLNFLSFTYQKKISPKSTQPVYFLHFFSLQCNFQCNSQCKSQRTNLIMPYGETQSLERLGKIRDDFCVCIAQIEEDIKLNNNLVKTQYLSAFGSVVECTDLSTIRTNAIFAWNIIDVFVKIVNLEELRQRYLVETVAWGKRNDVKKDRRRKRELVNEDNPWNPKHTRQNCLNWSLFFYNLCILCISELDYLYWSGKIEYESFY